MEVVQFLHVDGDLTNTSPLGDGNAKHSVKTCRLTDLTNTSPLGDGNFLLTIRNPLVADYLTNTSPLGDGNFRRWIRIRRN